MIIAKRVMNLVGNDIDLVENVLTEIEMELNVNRIQTVTAELIPEIDHIVKYMIEGTR